MGARQGYSIINGIVITILCLIGGMTLVLKVVPLEAMLGILLWIGVIMTSQAFQEIPKPHALAVAVGLIPALGAWAFLLIEASLRVAGSNLLDSVAGLKNEGIYLHGVISLNQGFLVSSMVLAAIMVFIIDRKFLLAAAWTASASILSFVGLIHAYELTETGVRNKFGVSAAPEFGIMYAFTALILLGIGLWRRKIERNGSGSGGVLSIDG
jgi:AGZA family xanthine/uracil permease-like MFS transporter